MNSDEFGEAVKAKYPDYRDVPNDQLSRMVVSKHPEYASQVDFGEQKSGTFDKMANAISGLAPGAPLIAESVGKNQENIFQGLTTNRPEGFVQRTANALPATIGGMLAGPGGAGAGEAARQGIVYANARLTGQPTPSLAEMGLQTGLAAGGQKIAQIAAPYIGKALIGGKVVANPAAGFLEGKLIPNANGELGGLAGSVIKAGKDFGKYLATNIAGVKPGSYEIAEKGAKSVSGYLNAGPEVGDKLAEGVRSVIGNAVKGGEESYSSLINAAKANPEYAGKTFDLQKAIGDKALDISEKFNFNATPNSEGLPGANAFWKQAKKLDSLSNAGLDDVYRFQRETGQLAKTYGARNPALAKAMGELADAAKNQIGEWIPEIGQANAAYRAAKTLEEETGKLVNSNDLIDYVVKSYKNPHNTLAKQAIESAVDKVPGFSEAINNVRMYGAAQDFAPLIRGIPSTGYGAAAIYGLGQGVHSAVKALGGGGLAEAGAGILAGAGAAVSSPRLSLAALQASQAAAPAIQAGISYAAEGGRALVPLAAQAVSFMAPASLAAFYRSPGVK